MSDFETPIEPVIENFTTVLNNLKLASLEVNNITLPANQISNVQYLDIEEDISTLFATKQPNIDSNSNITLGSLNGISSTTLSYIDPTSSIQTQLNGKQPTINSSSDITLNSLNGISSTTLGYIDPTSSIQTQLNGKQPTINSGSNITLNSLNGISSTTLGYIDPTSSIQTQLNGKQPTINSSSDITLNSLNGISSTTLGYIDPTSSIQTQINSKTTLSNALSSIQANSNTWTNLNSFNSYLPTSELTPNSNFQLANKKYVDDSISTIMLNADGALNSINELATALGNDSNYSSTITTALAGKFGLTANNTASGNNTFSGDDLFSGTNTFTGNIIANSITITPQQLSKIQYVDVSSDLSSLLNAKQNTISNINTLTGYVEPVDLTTAQTIAGIKTFSSPPVMSGASISNGTIPASALAQTYLTTSSASSNYCDLSNNQTIAGVKTFSSPPVMSGASISNATIPASALAQTYLTTSSASSTYQPLLSNTVSASIDLLTANRITEKIVGVGGSSPYTLNYSSGSVFYLSGTQPSSNFTCVLSNIPTSGSLNQYTITLIYNSGTACFCNSVSATDTGSSTIVANGTPKYVNNTAPTPTNSSVYIQTFTVLQCFATKYIITSLSTFN